MSVTISDIAKQLGTSNATVSRALRGDPKVILATRKRVDEAAREMNYQPNLMARGLTGGRTQTVGILWDLATPQPSAEMVRGLATRLEKRNWVANIADTRKDNAVMHSVLNDFQMRGVDAVVLELHASQQFDPTLTAHLQRFSAAVLTGGMAQDTPIDQVIHQRPAAVGAIADHFVKTGRKRPAVAITEGLARVKTEAFVNRLDRHGICVPPEAILAFAHKNVGANCREVMNGRYPDGRVPFDAIFCAGDLNALAMISWLQSNGIRVPDDVAVVGFSNTEMAECLYPPLASVERNDGQLADVIEQVLFARLEQPQLPPQRREVAMQFIWRESAG